MGSVLIKSSLISIQLVSPASGDFRFFTTMTESSRISIQLVSPASGDRVQKWTDAGEDVDFHSISFPSEWGHPRVNPAGVYQT